MDAQHLYSPLYAASVVGLSVFAFSRTGRSEPKATLARPGVWAAVGLVGVGIALLQFFLKSATGEWLAKVAGVAALVIAGVLATLASAERRRAELLASNRRQPVDAAARDASGRAVLVRGRLAAPQPVTSPSGLVCALYEAELRAPISRGARGALLAREAAGADWIYLEGERSRLALDRAQVTLHAREDIQRCTISASAGLGTEILAEGALTDDVLSYERVAKLGDQCLALGKVVTRNGRSQLVGLLGGKPLLVLGSETSSARALLLRRSWLLYVGAVLLCTASAWLLA